MPTVIDSLIVQLGLDAKDVDAKAPGVRKKLQDIEKQADKTEDSTKKMGKELKAAGASLGAFLAVLGGTEAIRSFVRDTVALNTQLHFLSQNLGMTVRSLFSLGAAGEQIGIGRNALQSLATMFREIPGQLEAGQQPAAIKLLARAGINWLGSPQDQMVGLAKWFQTMPPQVALGLGTAYGLSYDQMTFLLQGAQKVAADLRQTGIWSPTGKQAAQAAELKRQLVDLGLQWKKIGYDLLSVVTPAVEGFLRFLREIGAWAQRHEKIVAIIAGVAGVLGAIGALAGTIGAVAIAWGGLVAALEAAWPVLAVVGVVTALAGAVLLLWQDYKVWSEGGKSLFDWGAFQSAVRKAGDAFDYLKTKIEAATHSFNKWVDAHPSLKKALDAAIHYLVPFQNNGQFLAGMTNDVSDAVRRRGYGIASAEGFFRKGANNIPQRANNPGDIEWGPWAKAHGATGYLTAQGGHKIAVFPSTGLGWDALYSMLGEKRFSGLSDAQAFAEYTRLKGSDLEHYVVNAGRAMGGDRQLAGIMAGIAHARANASLAGSSQSSVVHSTDNSRTTHVGTVVIQSPVANGQVTPSMARGMDWTTLLAQSNAGLQ